VVGHHYQQVLRPQLLHRAADHRIERDVALLDHARERLVARRVVGRVPRVARAPHHV
jgi:hypothetical protein